MEYKYHRALLARSRSLLFGLTPCMNSRLSSFRALAQLTAHVRSSEWMVSSICSETVDWIIEISETMSDQAGCTDHCQNCLASQRGAIDIGEEFNLPASSEANWVHAVHHRGIAMLFSKTDQPAFSPLNTESVAWKPDEPDIQRPWRSRSVMSTMSWLGADFGPL